MAPIARLWPIPSIAVARAQATIKIRLARKFTLYALDERTSSIYRISFGGIFRLGLRFQRRSEMMDFHNARRTAEKCSREGDNRRSSSQCKNLVARLLEPPLCDLQKSGVWPKTAGNGPRIDFRPAQVETLGSPIPWASMGFHGCLRGVAANGRAESFKTCLPPSLRSDEATGAPPRTSMHKRETRSARDNSPLCSAPQGACAGHKTA